jgi:hypothetical protein
MSAAALEVVQQILRRHTVKGSPRALLVKIATVMPEGQTMTAPLDDDTLAADLECDRRTLQRARKVLVRHRVIRIDGRQGRPTSYGLPGAGEEPSLPLRADLRVASVKAIAATPLLDVLDTPATTNDDEIRANTVRHFAASWRSNLRHFAASHLRRFAAGCKTRAFTVRHFAASWRMVVDDSDARARGSTYYVRTHTHTAPPHPWHAWCAGRVHVPRDLHVEYREKLRLTDADLFAIYAEECAALTPTDRIPANDFTFWRPRLAARFTSRVAVSRAPPRPTRAPWHRPDILVDRGWTCPHHDAPCPTRDACIDRQVAAYHARKGRVG